MKNTKLLILSSLFAGLTCVATLLNIPSGDGYKNLGDCLVLLCGMIMGPLFGGLSAGIGSALADVILGYAYYAPATFLIKGVMAVLCGFVFKRIKSINIYTILTMIVAEIIMILGYFGYSMLLFGNFQAAFLDIPSNGLQGIVGIVGGIALYKIFEKNKYLNNIVK